MENKEIEIMGVLNITPNSFSDGACYNSTPLALKRVSEMINEGVDIIDIGGESTHPFSTPISENEELDRVIPIIEVIKKNYDITLSIDTYKSVVAEEAIKNGVKIINDISGFTFDSKMIDVAKKYNVKSIIMHTSNRPQIMQNHISYNNIIEDIYNFFDKQIKKLKENDINDIVIDPGFGFGKSLDDNYKLLANLKTFKKFNLPILVGISRKSMIGKLKDPDYKVDERLGGTITLNTLAILNGASIIRVHDIKEHKQMILAIERYIRSI